MKKVLVVIAILVAAAACGGAGSTANMSSGPQRSGVQYGGSAAGGVAPVPAGTQPGNADVANPATGVVPTVQGPQVIRQAQLTLTVGSGSFVSKLAAVRALVEGEQGYIAGTDAQTPTANDQIRTGVISFMVPAANFDATIDQLAGVGKVESEHITGTDVSAQYVDLKARLANQEAQRDAMLALLKGAKSISDIIAVQNQIGQITQQIEQLKGQISYFDHNTAFSTVTVTLTEAGAPVQAASSDSWGFATALSEGAHNFVTTINYIVAGLGAIGPVLVVVGLGYLVWRSRRRPVLPRHA